MNKVNILKIRLDSIEKKEYEKIFHDFTESGNHTICTPNPEIIIKAQKDKDLNKILNQTSSLNITDGIGLVWAAKYLNTKPVFDKYISYLYFMIVWFLSIIFMPIYTRFGNRPIKARVSGSDFIWDMAEYASKNHLEIFFVGGEPTVAERCSLKLQTDLPDLRVAGVHSGSIEDTEEIVGAIKKSKADILFVAYGAPKQEKWLAANLRQTGCRIGMGVGGSFDFVAGIKPRAPIWVQKLGFEWFFRLIIEPRRIVRQMAIPKFMFLVLIEKLKGER